MVHFPPLPSPDYVFIGRYSGMSQSGFPHSEIPGSKPACGSPRLIAACHVLHRLLAPRHSPYALSSLTKCSLHLTFFAFRPEGRIATNMWSKNYRLQNIQLSKNRRKLLSAFVASRLRRDSLRWLARPKQRIALRRLVENTGIEPVTSWLQTRRSPS